MPRRTDAYKQAGVDIDEMMSSVGAVKRLVNGTAVDGVLSDLGSFGGCFASPGEDSILVASTDGVGTKLKVAHMAGRHDTVGQDLVNHCVNDVLVQGAKPLFFLDYLGTSRLKAQVFKDVVSGMCRACRQNGCALLGGETAEMPGLYPPGEYDLVGTIVGAVKKENFISGDSIQPGDRILGLPSNGLHTNGYSLARKIIFESARLGIDDLFPGTRTTVGDVLLSVHKSYLDPVMQLLDGPVAVRGMAHITGGGFFDNILRPMPSGTQAVIDPSRWKVPPVLRFIQERGSVPREEMYRVFNMGIGYVLFVQQGEVKRALDVLKKAGSTAKEIGQVVKGKRGVTFDPAL